MVPARLEETIAKWDRDLQADVVGPVPLYENQAEMIARPLARRLRLKLGSYLLMRTRPRRPQLVLSRSQRSDFVRGAYATRERLRVDNLRVLLVDDVFTTDTTLDACSRALGKAGAAEVKGVTVGRVVPEWSPMSSAAREPGSTGKN